MMLKAVDSIFGEGAGHDDLAFVPDDAKYIQAVELGHADIQKKQVCALVLHHLDTGQRVCRRQLQLEFRNLSDMIFQQGQGQGFIVDGNTADHTLSFKSIIKSTRNLSAVSLMEKVCR